MWANLGRLFVTVLLLPLASSQWAEAGGSHRVRRYIAIRLQATHTYKCTSCAERMTEILRKQEGVREVRPIPAQDGAFVIFESGKGDVDEMRSVLKLAGLVTRQTWGPSAVKLDGTYEENPLDTIGHKRPTVKELDEAKKVAPKPVITTAATKKGKVYVPPKREALPVPQE